MVLDGKHGQHGKLRFHQGPIFRQFLLNESFLSEFSCGFQPYDPHRHCPRVDHTCRLLGSRQGAQHSIIRHGNTIFSRNSIITQILSNNNNHWKDYRDHADAKSSDDDSLWSSDSSFSNGSRWPERVWCEVFGDLTN